VTDSTPVEDPKDPDKCLVYAFLKLVTSDEQRGHWHKRYTEGGMGYGEAKKELTRLMNELLETFRSRYEELNKNRDYVEDVLAEGGKKARAIARDIMEKVRVATGITAGKQ